MTQRRTVIDLKPTGWLAWLVLVLLAVPLLVLSFFFVTVALALAAILIAFAVARFYWLRHTMKSGGPSRGNQRTDIIDVEPVDVSDASDAQNATPLNTLPPRSP